MLDDVSPFASHRDQSFAGVDVSLLQLCWQHNRGGRRSVGRDDCSLLPAAKSSVLVMLMVDGKCGLAVMVFLWSTRD